MRTEPSITLAPLEGMTQFAPLVAIGSFVRQYDLLAPVYGHMSFEQPTHTERPVEALVDLWISMLAGCRSVWQLNTRIRPDRTLAQSWGRGCFAEQSTVARVLDSCQAEQVAQLRTAVRACQQWIGATAQHDWRHPLLLDIDLTSLPAGKQAEGSKKGYFPKKGGVVASCAVSEPPATTRALGPGSMRAILSASMFWLTPSGS